MLRRVDCAKVGESPIDGRGLFANANRKAGDTLLYVERPLGSAVSMDKLEDTCANCYAVAEKEDTVVMAKNVKIIMACNGCKVNRYCGKVR